MIGKTLGHYEIVDTLGAGGMGEVYLGEDTRLNRRVAIKVLPTEFVADSQRVARFRREAELLAALNSQHIAQIYGLEQQGEAMALVLELVEGPTLAERLEDGPLPIDEALRIALQLAEGLEVAHEQGSIHRDLKPANINVRAGEGSIAYAASQYVFVAPFREQDAEAARVSSMPGRHREWSPGGETLYFIDDEGSLMAVDVNPGATFTAGAARLLFDPPAPMSGVDYEVSSDGSRFLFTVRSGELPEQTIQVIMNWAGQER